MESKDTSEIVAISLDNQNYGIICQESLPWRGREQVQKVSIVSLSIEYKLSMTAIAGSEQRSLPVYLED